MIAQTMRPVLYMPDDHIIRAGDVGHEMFFISRGEVVVTSPDESEVYTEMSDGAFFGEVGVVYSVPRTASVIAVTYCDLFVLSKEE